MSVLYIHTVCLCTSMRRAGRCMWWNGQNEQMRCSGKKNAKKRIVEWTNVENTVNDTFKYSTNSFIYHRLFPLLSFCFSNVRGWTRMWGTWNILFEYNLHLLTTQKVHSTYEMLSCSILYHPLRREHFFYYIKHKYYLNNTWDSGANTNSHSSHNITSLANNIDTRPTKISHVMCSPNRSSREVNENKLYSHL